LIQLMPVRAALLAFELWRQRAARTGISWIKGVG